MADSNSRSYAESSSSNEDSSADRKSSKNGKKLGKAKLESGKSQSKSKNDSGRHNKTPGQINQVNVGLSDMPEKEKKRKQENDALDKADVSLRTGKREKSDKKGSTRGHKFTRGETGTMLLSIYEKMDDAQAASDFMKRESDTTRTKPSVKARVAKVRKSLQDNLLEVNAIEVERNGVIFFSLVPFL